MKEHIQKILSVLNLQTKNFPEDTNISELGGGATASIVSWPTTSTSTDSGSSSLLGTASTWKKHIPRISVFFRKYQILSCGYSASTKCWEVAKPWKKPFYFPVKQSTFHSLSWKILASHLSPEPIRTLGGLLWLRFCQLFAGLSCQKILSVRVGAALSNCRQPKKELSEHSNRKVVWIKYNIIYLPQY